MSYRRKQETRSQSSCHQSGQRHSIFQLASSTRKQKAKAKWLFLGQHSTSKRSVFDKSYWGWHTIVWTHINLGFRRTPKGARGNKTEGDGPGQGDQAEGWWKARTLSEKDLLPPAKQLPWCRILFMPWEAKIQILMRNVPIFKSRQITHLRIAAHGLMSL